MERLPMQINIFQGGQPVSSKLPPTPLQWRRPSQLVDFHVRLNDDAPPQHLGIGYLFGFGRPF
jgi:hypothetical protein